MAVPAKMASSLILTRMKARWPKKKPCCAAVLSKSALRTNRREGLLVESKRAGRKRKLGKETERCGMRWMRGQGSYSS